MGQLNQMQRYAISLMLKEKKTQSAIAEAIGVDKSTISRELNKHLLFCLLHFLLCSNNTPITANEHNIWPKGGQGITILILHNTRLSYQNLDVLSDPPSQGWLNVCQLWRHFSPIYRQCLYVGYLDLNE